MYQGLAISTCFHMHGLRAAVYGRADLHRHIKCSRREDDGGGGRPAGCGVVLQRREGFPGAPLRGVVAEAELGYGV